MSIKFEVNNLATLINHYPTLMLEYIFQMMGGGLWRIQNCNNKTKSLVRRYLDPRKELQKCFLSKPIRTYLHVENCLYHYAGAKEDILAELDYIWNFGVHMRGVDYKATKQKIISLLYYFNHVEKVTGVLYKASSLILRKRNARSKTIHLGIPYMVQEYEMTDFGQDHNDEAQAVLCELNETVNRLLGNCLTSQNMYERDYLKDGDGSNKEYHILKNAKELMKHKLLNK